MGVGCRPKEKRVTPIDNTLESTFFPLDGRAGMVPVNELEEETRRGRFG